MFLSFCENTGLLIQLLVSITDEQRYQKFGFRFSKKAATPSLKSGLSNAAANTSLSSSYPFSGSINPRFTVRIAAVIAVWERPDIFSKSRSQVALNSSAGTV